MFLVDENISTLNQVHSFTVVGAPSNVIEGAAQTSLEEKKSVLCRCDVPIKSRRQW
jgi:hypothetical protein